MRLTAQQFTEIISSLKSDKQDRRRTSPRVGMRLQVPIIPCLDDAKQIKEQVVWLKDLSVSGMCFVHSKGLAVGSGVGGGGRAVKPKAHACISQRHDLLDDLDVRATAVRLVVYEMDDVAIRLPRDRRLGRWRSVDGEEALRQQ